VSVVLIFTYSVVQNYKNSRGGTKVTIWRAINDHNSVIIILSCATVILSLYSLYIGTKNIENGEPMALGERYKVLLKGIIEVFFKKESGVMYIFFGVLFNLSLLYSLCRNDYQKYFRLVFLLLAFCAIYIALLPLGGYRGYRPLILRQDTSLPVLIILFYIWATSGIFLVKRIPRNYKAYPLGVIVFTCFFYTITDMQMPTVFSIDAERQFMERAAASKIDCVPLERWAPVASWGFNSKCEDGENVAALLFYYHITPRKIYLYYPEVPEAK